MADSKKVITTPTMEQKIWAAVSYLWVLSVIVLVARKKTEYIRFHANQGVFLFGLSLIGMIFPPINIVVFIIAVVGIYKAYMGEEWKMPVIGDTAVSFSNWLIKTLKL